MSFSATALSPPDGSLTVQLSPTPDYGVSERSCAEVLLLVAQRPEGSHISVTAPGIERASSEIVAWLLHLARTARARGVTLSLEYLPHQIARPLSHALATPEAAIDRTPRQRDTPLGAIGRETVRLIREIQSWLAFLGELILALRDAILRRVRIPISDVWVTIDECGPSALPIVTLINILVGVILAFIGAQQLRQFGAQIYVANLVSVGMLREMGAVMGGVIMAGRTGAAFAAQLGTMQVNDEIDALRTFGISPMHYLVVPRVIALIIMMPLLCIYADLLGIVGGGLVSALSFDITPWQYANQARGAIVWGDAWLGIIKSCIFGVLIAIAGCLNGIRCGRSASAVGEAATAAVVTGIVAIIASDAFFAFVASELGW